VHVRTFLLLLLFSNIINLCIFIQVFLQESNKRTIYKLAILSLCLQNYFHEFHFDFLILIALAGKNVNVQRIIR
jgi:hypothetical protein